ncbi:hypothetical protein LCGC14_3084790, partial [marine sediment metagenome]
MFQEFHLYLILRNLKKIEKLNLEWYFQLQKQMFMS